MAFPERLRTAEALALRAPDRLPAAPDRLPLSEAAASYARAALAPATRRAYRSHLRAWEAWCRTRDLPPLPAPPPLVANHLAELAGRRSVSTLSCRLAAIIRAHRLLGLGFDVTDAGLRETVAGIVRTHGRAPRRRAAPLRTDQILRIAAACGEDLRGLRDRALLLVGFAGAFRRSELVGIRCDDLAFGADGVSVRLPRSKEDQAGIGAHVHVAANRAGGDCPVRALRRWLTAAGIASGSVFRRIGRGTTLGAAPLTPESVRLILRARAAAAGLSANVLATLSPHSLRAGCITTLAEARVHERDIMAHSRHASQSVMRGYIRASGTGLPAAVLWSGSAGNIDDEVA
ncbi:MAG: tyrosine-type recombinase/integrase [Alphaproteobacteria bacterium]|nr:tyrosine-type recombinase/integrase [Alphaproteobacteria bacterium]